MAFGPLRDLIGFPRQEVPAASRRSRQNIAVVAKDRVQPGLLVKPRPDESARNENAKPAKAHESDAERCDRQQGGNFIDPVEHDCPPQERTASEGQCGGIDAQTKGPLAADKAASSACAKSSRSGSVR